MKSLIVLRHGKSEHPIGMSDFDRPLNPRGQRDALRTGQLFAERALTPDLIVTSPANRARSTAQLVAEGCEYGDDPVDAEDLYLPSLPDIYSVVRDIPEQHDRVIIVGHNPGFHMFAYHLARTIDHFPTCAWAQLDFDVEYWGEVINSTPGELADYWYPKIDD